MEQETTFKRELGLSSRNMKFLMIDGEQDIPKFSLKQGQVSKDATINNLHIAPIVTSSGTRATITTIYFIL